MKIQILALLLIANLFSTGCDVSEKERTAASQQGAAKDLIEPSTQDQPNGSSQSGFQLAQTTSQYIEQCDKVGVKFPIGPLPISGPTSQWREVAKELNTDQLALKSFGPHKGSLYTFENNSTICLALRRNSADEIALGVHCYAKENCKVCSTDIRFKPNEAPSSLTFEHSKQTFPFGGLPVLKGEVEFENCASCHLKGPIMASRPVLDSLNSSSIKNLIKTCESTQGPTWVGSLGTAFGGKANGFCPVPENCQSCHAKGILKSQTNNSFDYCGSAGAHVFKSATGSMRAEMLDAIGEDPNACRNFAACMGCSEEQMCPSPVNAKVSINVRGNGVVESMPAGIKCGGFNNNCSAKFPLGSRVRLAFTGKNPSFTGAGCSSTACEFAIDGDRHVEVSFDLGNGSTGSGSSGGSGGGGNGGGGNGGGGNGGGGNGGGGNGGGGNGGGGQAGSGGTGTVGQPNPSGPNLGSIFYRTRNPNKPYHFFTTNKAEYQNVIRLKWADETGFGGACLFKSKTLAFPNPKFGKEPGAQPFVTRQAAAVHRFYNPSPNAGFHSYTTNSGEAAILSNIVGLIWEKGEKVPGTAKLPNSSVPEGFLLLNPESFGLELKPVHRFYSKTHGYHLYTSNMAEVQFLRGNPATWRDEGLLGYGPKICQ